MLDPDGMCTPHVLPRHAPLCAELEGDDTTGALCQEYKVVAPAHQNESRRMGRGSVGCTAGHGGTVADVLGHLYAFGNTEERYRIKILGCKGKGTLGVDRPFNPHYQSWSRDGRATTTTLFGLRNKKALIENGCDKGVQGSSS